jgi:predicted RNA-binding protein with PUA-like domain
MAKRPRRYWLMKSEPSVYSIDHLERDGETYWDGVRNYQARNFMRDDMAVGDLVLYYHSNADPMGVSGVAEVRRGGYPDPTQFNRRSKYFDEKSSKDDPRWFVVDVGFVERFERVVTLAELKAEPKLEGMKVIQRGMRLSVQPVDKPHFKQVLRMAGATTKVR